MTTYIDSGVTSMGEAPSTAPAFSPVSAMPGLMALWSWPLTALQIWTAGWTAFIPRAEPETDRAPDAPQLPVPDPLQHDKDSELFA